MRVDDALLWGYHFSFIRECSSIPTRSTAVYDKANVAPGGVAGPLDDVPFEDLEQHLTADFPN